MLRIRAAAAAHACAAAVVDGAALTGAGEAGVPVGFCGAAGGAAAARRRLLTEAALAGEAFAGLDGPPRRLTLRHPRRGERFAPLGLGAETTLARHLAAARVPADRRPRTVVLDVDGPPPGWGAPRPPGLRRPSGWPRVLL